MSNRYQTPRLALLTSGNRRYDECEPRRLIERRLSYRGSDLFGPRESVPRRSQCYGLCCCALHCHGPLIIPLFRDLQNRFLSVSFGLLHHLTQRRAGREAKLGVLMDSAS